MPCRLAPNPSGQVRPVTGRAFSQLLETMRRAVPEPVDAHNMKGRLHNWDAPATRGMYERLTGNLELRELHLAILLRKVLDLVLALEEVDTGLDDLVEML